MFSEKTRRMNSPSSLGSKVEGTMQYTPGGKLNRQLTSLKFINDGDLAHDALYLKKFKFKGFGRRSGSSNYKMQKTFHQTHAFINYITKNLIELIFNFFCIGCSC